MIQLKSESNRPPRRKRRLRLLLLLLGLPAAALLIEHWRGDRALNSWKRDMAARGEVLEANRLWPAASRESAEFSNQLAQASLQIRAKLSQYSGQLTPIVAVAPGRWRRGSQEPQPPFWDKRRSTNTWQELDKLCQESQPNLQTLRELMKEPPPGMGYEVMKFLEDDTLPILTPIRFGAQSLHAVVMNDLHKGDLPAAVRDLGALAAFGKLYEQDPLLVCYMIRMAILSVSIDIFWDALQADGWAEPQLATLQRQCVDNGRLLSQMPRTLEAERAERIYWFQWLRSHSYQKWIARYRGFFESIGAKLPVEDTAEQIMFWRQWFFHPLWSCAWSEQEELEYLKHQQLDLMILREAVQQRSLLRLKEKMTVHHQSDCAPRAAWRFYIQMPLVDRLVEIVSTNKLPAATNSPNPQINITNKPAARITTTNQSVSHTETSDADCPYTQFSRAWSTSMRILTLNEMVITAIALKRYELRHGKPPSKLAVLVPEFLPAVPTDFMDGQPLRYRLNADGAFTLYSVGDNLRDDGGDPFPETPSRFYNDSPWDGRDWVWPRAVTRVQQL